MGDWRIQKKLAACRVCSREFTDGERHFSLLSVRGDELEREDFCGNCWHARPQDDAHSELFWWRTRRQIGKRRGLALNLEALEALFASLEGRSDRALRELRYLLCLVLMRKRRLKTVRVVRDVEGESFIVRRPRRQEELRVFVYDFTPERVAELREKLRRIFDGAEPDTTFAPLEGDGDADGIGAAPSAEGDA
jgi:hypothetical protein